MAKIKIYYPTTGSIELRCDKAKVKKTLNKEDYISCRVISETKLTIPLASYIDSGTTSSGSTTRYVLNKTPVETKLASTLFNYDLRFESPMYDLKKSTFQILGKTDTSFIGTASDFLDLIVSSLAVDGYTFTAGSVDSTNELNLKFTGEKCWAVLNRICTDFNLEFIFDSNEISLTYRVINDRTGVSLSQGEGNGIRMIDRIESNTVNTVTRLYYEGSDKNLPSGYGNKRLTGSAPYVSNNESLYGVYSDVEYFEDIFPTYTGTIGAITYINDDKTPTFIDAATPFDLNDYNIPGVLPQISMIDGNCAGYVFEINYYNDDSNRFSLKPQNDSAGNQIPSPSGLNIATGDTFKLLNIELPTSYVTTAETALDVAAAARILEISDPPVEFKITADSKIVNDIYVGGQEVFDVGDQLNITDSDLIIPSSQRIIDIEYDLFYKARVEFNISEARFILPGRTEEIELYLNTKATELNKLYDPTQLKKTFRTSDDVWKQAFSNVDSKLDVDFNARKESFDPVMLALDSGEPQYVISGKIEADDTSVTIAGGEFIYRNYNALPRYQIEETIEAGGTYDPKQTWTITGNTVLKSAGVFNYLYAKVDNTKDVSGALIGTNAELHASPDVITNKYTTDDFLYYMIGTVDVDNNLSLLWGNINNPIIDTNGFTSDERTNTTISFVDGTRTFTITPTSATFSYYVGGTKYTRTGSDSIAITDTSGLHAFYYVGNTLTTVSNPTPGQIDAAIRTTALIAYVYWNATTGEHIYLGDERHGISMSPSTHSYLHFTQGAKYLSGGALIDMDVDGSGNDATAAQFGINSGSLADEDIMNANAAVASTVGFPIYYKTGASLWNRVYQAGFPVYATGSPNGRVYYNQDVGGVWQLTEITNGDFVLCHVFFTNDINESPFVIMGENEYTTLGNARAGAEVEILDLETTGFPSEEFVAIATVIFQSRSNYSNAVKSRVRSTDTGDDYIDWRFADKTGSGGGSGTATSYLDLTDTNSLYTGFAGQIPQVNATETGLDFYDIFGNLTSPFIPYYDGTEFADSPIQVVSSDVFSSGSIDITKSQLISGFLRFSSSTSSAMHPFIFGSSESGNNGIYYLAEPNASIQTGFITAAHYFNARTALSTDISTGVLFAIANNDSVKVSVNTLGQISHFSANEVPENSALYSDVTAAITAGKQNLNEVALYGNTSTISLFAPTVTGVGFYDIIGWGDSLTEGVGGSGTTYLTSIDTLFSQTTYNEGVGGETSTEVKTRFDAAPEDWGKFTIIWVGRNNYNDPTQIKADIASMISDLGHDRYLVLSVLNGEYSTEYSGGAGYITITTLNNDLSALYGDNYLDVREWLVNQYDSGDTQDVIDYGHDIVPSTLRSDDIHLNANGYTILGEYIYNYLSANLYTDLTLMNGGAVLETLESPPIIGNSTPNKGYFTTGDFEYVNAINTNNDNLSVITATKSNAGNAIEANINSSGVTDGIVVDMNSTGWGASNKSMLKMNSVKTGNTGWNFMQLYNNSSNDLVFEIDGYGDITGQDAVFDGNVTGGLIPTGMTNLYIPYKGTTTLLNSPISYHSGSGIGINTTDPNLTGYPGEGLTISAISVEQIGLLELRGRRIGTASLCTSLSFWNENENLANIWSVTDGALNKGRIDIKISDGTTSNAAMRLYSDLSVNFYGPILNTDTITGNAIIKTGGTSVQFLKADGSVDSNTYLTTADNNYVNSIAFSTLTGDLVLGRNGLSSLTENLDGRYLTSYTETDPIYVASSWYSTPNNSTNWDLAYTHSQLTTGNPHDVSWTELSGVRSGISLSGFDDDLSYDNYVGWYLFVDGATKGAIGKLEVVDFTAGTNVTLGYSATNNKITINSIADSLWLASGSDIYFDTGKVGIGQIPSTSYDLAVGTNGLHCQGTVSGSALRIGVTTVIDNSRSATFYDLDIDGNASITNAGIIAGIGYKVGTTTVIDVGRSATFNSLDIDSVAGFDNLGNATAISYAVGTSIIIDSSGNVISADGVGTAGTFTTVDGKTVSYSAGGIITSVV